MYWWFLFTGVHIHILFSWEKWDIFLYQNDVIELSFKSVYNNIRNSFYFVVITSLTKCCVIKLVKWFRLATWKWYDRERTESFWMENKRNIYSGIWEPRFSLDIKGYSGNLSYHEYLCKRQKPVFSFEILSSHFGAPKPRTWPQGYKTFSVLNSKLNSKSQNLKFVGIKFKEQKL